MTSFPPTLPFRDGRENAMTVLPAVGFAVLSVLEIWLIASPSLGSSLNVVATVVVLLLAVTLIFRESFAWPAFWVNSALVMVVSAMGYAGDAYAWMNLVALYGLAANTTIARSAIGGLASLGVMGFFFWQSDERAGAATWLLAALIWGIGWLAGRIRQSTARTAELQRLGEVQQLELERNAELLELETERNRIAREVHDLVGHTVNVMVVHAAAGRRSPDPEAAREALRTVETTGRAALEEIDRTLALIRSAPSSGQDQNGNLPGLANISRLVEQMDGAGAFRVTHSQTGDPALVRHDMQFAAYRIVQEALTNVLKHSNATNVEVAIDSGPVLRVSVSDDGNNADELWKPGRGMSGMKERARAHGGTCSVTRNDRGGVLIEAEFPMEGSES